MPNTVSVSIQIPAAQVEILQPLADSQGKDLGQMLSEDGRTPSQIVNDRLNLAYWQMVAAGTYPAEVVAHARDQDLKTAAALKANANIPAGA